MTDLERLIANAERTDAYLVASGEAVAIADLEGDSASAYAAFEAARGLAHACAQAATDAVLAAPDGEAWRLRLLALQRLDSRLRMRLEGIDPDAVDILRAAVADLRQDWDTEPPDDDEDGWPIAPRADIEAILRGEWEAVVPDVLARADGSHLLYSGRVHSLAGEPGGGKTWVALAAVAQVLEVGGVAMLVDYEDRLDTAVRRLVALGATDQAICERFRYVTPTIAFRGGKLPRNVVVASDGVALVVIDSVGEALAHSELSQNDDGEVRAWMDATARRLADGGAAVLMLDHVTKDSEHRGRWAIGSQRKLAAIDGIAYMMTTTVAATKEQVGHARITCAKDRLGTYQHGSVVAEVTISPTADDGVEVTIAAPTNVTESGETLLTGYMEKVSKFLEEMGEGMSGNAIENTVDGANNYIRKALQQLHDGGWTTQEKGRRGAVIHSLVKPFREVDLLYLATSPDLASTSPTARSERPRHLAGGLRPGEVGEVGDATPAESTSPNGEVDESSPTQTADPGEDFDVLSML